VVMLTNYSVTGAKHILSGGELETVKFLLKFLLRQLCATKITYLGTPFSI